MNKSKIPVANLPSSYFYIQKSAKIWVENTLPKTYSDTKEEPYHLEYKTEAEVKYLSTSRPVESIKYEKTMAYINDVDIHVNDMAAVEDINEVDLLNNLKNRFLQNQIFTNVGPTLIIMNPYQIIDGAFGEKIINDFLKYHKSTKLEDRKEIENPHLYDLTLIAIKQLKEYRKNQAIVISGESGAGKTETAKNAMKCITYYFANENAPGRRYSKIGNKKISLEDQILGCNPILEAFGNSKTIKNDNSSRFGKYVTINLDVESGRIEGAQIVTYLLEKSRLCEPAEGERNYHIFYQILKGAGDQMLSEIYLTDNPANYKYLSVSKCFDVEHIDDKSLFNETMEAFLITGFTDQEIKTIFKIMAACLLLGNLTFKDVNDQSTIEDSSLLEKICSLLQCSKEALTTSLTINIRAVAKQEVKSYLKASDSYIYRNNFAKELYNRVFNWIVKKLNKQLAPEIDMSGPNKKYIGLLDIFGFECFQFNSLEQLCINFTNEKLQQLYINDIFISEQLEFIREGLKEFIGEINFKDNQAIIDSMDNLKSGTGIFQILDNMNITNKDDKTFFDTIKTTHPTNPCVKVEKFATNKFSILHTAKKVEYTTNGFVLKNLDEVKNTMLEAMMQSENKIIKYIFLNAIDEEDYQIQIKLLQQDSMSFKKDNKYLGGKFRNEMIKLMNELTSCECHYVRCLKPNEAKKKDFFVPTFVFQQIRYLGILDTIRVRKEGFPCRKKFRDFFLKFAEVCWFEGIKSVFEYQKIHDENFFKDLCIKCLDYIAKDRTTKECLVGSTKIFMKQSFYSNLERIRSNKMKKKEDSALTIGKIYKGSKFRKKFSDFRKKTKYLQVFYRTKKDYIKTQKMRAAAKKIQATYRAALMNRTYKYMLVCIYKLQNVIKSFLFRQHVKRMKQAIFNMVPIMKKFLIKARIARRNKIRKTVLSIFDRAWEYILKKHRFFSAIKIQSHIRKFLTVKKHYTKVLKGRIKREEFLRKRSSLIIQTNFRSFKMRKFLLLNRLAVFLIQGHWRMLKYSSIVMEMRKGCLIIQRNIRIYLLRKQVIDKRLEEYFKEEKFNMEKVLFETSQSLFPNMVKNPNEREHELNEFENYDQVYTQESKEIRLKTNKAILPEFDPYVEPKISPFAKIVDFDVIIDSNEIYNSSWGKEFEKIYNFNMQHKTPIQIIQTGECHSIALNSKGKLFSWGWNNHGQCEQVNKLPSNRNLPLPELIRDDFGNLVSLPSMLYKTSSTKPISFEEVASVRQGTCGEDFTFIIDENNNAYGFGNNSKGQLGLGHNTPIEKPQIVQEMKGRIREIKSTGEINIVVTTESELFIWQYENLFHSFKPLKLFLDKKITIQTVSCGKNFAVILSKQGILFSFGKSNKNGELGLGDNNPRLVPEPLILLAENGEKITQISCGYKHTVAKSSIGKVFTWGNNSDGQLGIGSYFDCNIPALVNFDNLFPYRIKIIQVTSGFRSSVFLTETRNVLCAGTTGYYVREILPTKFDFKFKTPEIADDSSFSIMRILCTWNKSFSVFYCTFGDVRVLFSKIKNKHKLNTILNTLASKWECDSLDAPFIESLSGYFHSSFMKKPNEDKKILVKNKK